MDAPASQSPVFKIVNDPIHGHIRLHPLSVAIVDTPQFQRLRNIKQLGQGYLVYPGGCHNRFEHCLGTAHLARQYVQVLAEGQPELEIDEKDTLCVEIAALCHDLGHGPFSHLWEEFMAKNRNGHIWKHEETTVKLLQHLIRENELEGKFRLYFGEEYPVYLGLIKEQIIGSLESRKEHPWVFGEKPHRKDKSFLFDIVSNKVTGIDVDKWDYIARDSYHLGFHQGFNHKRLLHLSRVLHVGNNGTKQICIRDKEMLNISEMFHARWMLHRRAYQHDVNKIIEAMTVDALVAANKHIKIPGSNGDCSLAEASNDMVAFSLLTDHIFQSIQMSSNPDLDEAKAIIRRIQRRQLYTFIDKIHDPDGTLQKIDTETYIEEIINCIPTQTHIVKPEDIKLILMRFDYGFMHVNPVERVHFYSKTNPDIATRVRTREISQMLPCNFQEQLLLCLCQSSDLAHVVRDGFDIWKRNRRLNSKTPEYGENA